jgi:hypothetical protein
MGAPGQVLSRSRSQRPRRRAAAGRITLSNQESPIHFPATPKMVNDRTVAMLTAGSRSKPSRWQAQQERASDHECQNHCSMPSFVDRVLRLSDGLIDAVFGVRLRQTGPRLSQTNQIVPIVLLHCLPPNGGCYDPRRLGSYLGVVSEFGWRMVRSKQPIKLKRQQGLGSRCGRSCQIRSSGHYSRGAESVSSAPIRIARPQTKRP